MFSACPVTRLCSYRIPRPRGSPQGCRAPIASHPLTAPLRSGLGPIPAPSPLHLAWVSKAAWIPHLLESRISLNDRGLNPSIKEIESNRRAGCLFYLFISYQLTHRYFPWHLPITPPPNAHYAALCPLSKANCLEPTAAESVFRDKSRYPLGRAVCPTSCCPKARPHSHSPCLASPPYPHTQLSGDSWLHPGSSYPITWLEEAAKGLREGMRDSPHLLPSGAASHTGTFLRKQLRLESQVINCQTGQGKSSVNNCHSNVHIQLKSG